MDTVLRSRWDHVISNLVVQLLLGIPLEMVHDWWRVAITYFLGVIAGQFICFCVSVGLFLPLKRFKPAKLVRKTAG